MALHTAEFTKRLELLQERMTTGELTDRSYRLLNIHLALKEHMGRYKERPRAEDLSALAQMILHEELTDKHSDKMSRTEYPFTSESQEEEREKRHCLVPDVIFGDRRFNGKRTHSHTDEDGNTTSSKGQITLENVAEFDRADIQIIVRDALANSGLTERQKEAVYLVFYKRMTQEDAAEVMGISRRTIREFISTSIQKLRKYMKVSPAILSN